MRELRQRCRAHFRDDKLEADKRGAASRVARGVDRPWSRLTGFLIYARRMNTVRKERKGLYVTGCTRGSQAGKMEEEGLKKFSSMGEIKACCSAEKC